MRNEIEQNKAELLERRYTYPVGKLMGVVREKLKWADGKMLKEITDREVGVSTWWVCFVSCSRSFIIFSPLFFSPQFYYLFLQST